VTSRDQPWLNGTDDRHTARTASPGSARTVSESVTLPQHPSAARTARRFTATACGSSGQPALTCETAQLLVSEVVTNAVVHGASAPRLTIWTTDRGVRIEVGDTSPDPPLQSASDAEAGSGRGLAILDACASSWGCRTKRHGKVVWFTVDTDQQPDLAQGDTHEIARPVLGWHD
jgi:anti-sigma regulatory factor (Ser/Thr protein kinase)